MNANPILIFGADRSGTSVVANMVDEWGAYGGLTLETRGDTDNPYGYHENMHFGTIISKHLGNVFQVNYRQVLEDVLQSPKALSDFNNFFNEMDSYNKIWYIKEPFIGLIIPFLLRFVENPTCIITVRNPYESALSWQTFCLPENAEYSTIFSNLLRWQYILSETLINTDRLNKIFVSYEDLHCDPGKEANRISEFLDKHYSKQSSRETVISMTKVVDNSLYRNKARVNFADFEGASFEQKKLYSNLKELVSNPDLNILEKSKLPLGWHEYVNNANAIFELSSKERSALLYPFMTALSLISQIANWVFVSSSTVRKIVSILHRANNRNAKPKYKTYYNIRE
jgi:hypothetical protein